MSKRDEFVNIRYIIGTLLAEIDISLLKEADQETDKDKIYTKEEIREALTKSGQKLAKVLIESRIDICEKIKRIN